MNNLALALSMLSFAGLGIGVMELDNWRKRRADRRDFTAITSRQRAKDALSGRTW